MAEEGDGDGDGSGGFSKALLEGAYEKFDSMDDKFRQMDEDEEVTAADTSEKHMSPQQNRQQNTEAAKVNPHSCFFLLVLLFVSCPSRLVAVTYVCGTLDLVA